MTGVQTCALPIWELKITFMDGKSLSLIKPVGIVGEMGIFTGEPRSASVSAATDCLLFTIHRKELFKTFEKDSFLALQILMNVIKDLSNRSEERLGGKGCDTR